jgi:hypothetical protein
MDRVIPVEPSCQDDRSGYEYDPYSTREERAEILHVGSWTYDGQFSNYREIHIGIAGAYAGLRTKTFEDLPKCPPLWGDEAQYYEGLAAIFYDLKRGTQGALVPIVYWLIHTAGIV